MRLLLSLVSLGALISGCGGGGAGDPPPADPPAPAISALSPASAAAGVTALTVTVNGSNFVASSAVAWNGAMLQTTYASATQLTAQVPASDIAGVGTANVTVANPASDGGTSAATSFSVTAAQSGPALVQSNSFQTTSNNLAANSTVQFTSPTKAGDTIWVVATVSDFGGIHTIAVSDTQGNTYTLLDQENDVGPGFQTVAHFYAQDIVGDAAIPDTITVTWSDDDYKGVLIAEISGTTSVPLAGHAANMQDGLGGGTNNVTAGPVDLTAPEAPALLLALSMNTSGGTSDTGGSGFGGAAAGTGMTQVNPPLWNWGVNLATFVTANVTSAESISSTFSAPDTGSTVDNFVTVAVVFH